MRKARLITPGLSYYHCVSRVVDGRFIFGDEEKYYFRKVMRGLEHLMGVRVVTYCIMSNHFHVLLQVPDEKKVVSGEDVTDAELVKLVRPLYGKDKAEMLEAELKNCDQWGFEKKKAEIRAGYLERRGRLDLFMKDLKQRFTQWYNRKEGRRGTLWEDRYKSVVVGNSDDAILAMAAYIDLNPVRAAMVGDPADYAYSGYGEACAGKKLAQRGLALALELPDKKVSWSSVGAEYRRLLYGIGEERGLKEDETAKRKGFSREEALTVLKEGGRLPLWKALRCRVRYFSDGAIFGSAEFVEEVFERNRDRYPEDRKSGARKMRGGEWGRLRTLRDLRVEVFR